MDAIEILIADSLAESLTAHEYPCEIDTITAVRRLVPDDALDAATSLKVSVVPGQVEVTNQTRDGDLFDCDIHVIVCKHFSTDAELDQLIDLRSAIVDAIRSKVLPASTPAMPTGVVWSGITNATTFDRDHLQGHRVFLSDISVTYRRLQAKVTA